MVEVTVNSVSINVEDGMTVLQACEIAGVEIPRFCYHERLAIAGNCRMCLVEIVGQPKLAASCAMPIANGMVINTDTEKVKKARKGVLELLLVNHPLDCPICDQGGECDLQDQVVAYGCGIGRYHEEKRAVSKKAFGPLIENSMNRCIHCTRCVRFLSDVAGTYEFGTFGRGEKMEIDTCVEQGVTSELSGNIIDLCPVGALTSKPYAFKARPWELYHCDTIDVMDAVGCSIRVDCRGLNVLRVLPRLNEDVNEEWISDKTRFAYDGLALQRLDKPCVRKDDRLVEVSWDDAIEIAAGRLSGVQRGKIAAIAGDLVDCESMFLLRRLMFHLGSSIMDCRQDGAKLSALARNMYLFNTSIAGIEAADFCLLINADLRVDAPIINARVRKQYLERGMRIASIGCNFSYNYQVDHLGDDMALLGEIYNGDHELCKALMAAEHPIIILGQDAIVGDKGHAVLMNVLRIARKFNIVRDGWNGFNVLHKAAARVGGLDVGFLPEDPVNFGVSDILSAAASNDVQVLYLLGADEVDIFSVKSKNPDLFVIYQGHHADRGAQVADLILPGAAYTEKRATYVNTEGRVQRTEFAVRSPGEAREDWSVISDLAERLGCPFGYESVFDVWKGLAALGAQFEDGNIGKLVASEGDFSKAFDLEGVDSSLEGKFTVVGKNFYMTDPISRASPTMAKCTKFFMRQVC
ncbi:NADH dehydrogenase [Anaplasma phagocytophilum str. MRK]|uniref:NADH-quinone oxidoreductase subunit NuoG n=1 Tax=Anaplasma phagocytophilum TaxID=948 RepID=UPI0005338BA3|nr:NADH-quinone oxidoreductase subunit NuoG [Anaplasma phagocytophilum]KDB55993.1 NADH dehydrogenase [Anaplasma phagocytophilum str. MRK]